MTEKYVCEMCVPERALQAFIRAKAQSTACSYCQRQMKRKKIAVDVRDLARHIERALITEYEHVADSLPWDSGEGGYQFGPQHSTYDLLKYEVGLDIPSQILFKDLLACLPDQDWCGRYRPGGREEDLLMDSWDRFVSLVKHKTRYMFFPQEDPHGAYWGDEIPPGMMLDLIAGVIESIGLVQTISDTEVIIRARSHAPDRDYKTVAELGPPKPHEVIYPNRMSPSGIAMFYGTSDERTAVLETCSPTPDPTVVTISRFHLARLRIPLIHSSRSTRLVPLSPRDGDQ